MRVNHTDKTSNTRLAIVGGGPRGLSALESVYGTLAAKGNPKSLHTLFFESGKFAGAGQVYDLEQPDTNWLNVSERGLTIPSRKEIKCDNFSIPSFPSYHDWSGYNQKIDAGAIPDKFPLRSVVGKYLNERYSSIASVLESEGLLQRISGKVVKTDWNEEAFSIALNDGTTYYTDELVLTIGHQPTRHSKQIANWLDFSKGKSSLALMAEPYPVEKILTCIVLDFGATVAVRGFGLAMIDVMRALTVGVGGKFKIIDEATQSMAYEKSGDEPAKIFPFSLDGLPMAPKPLSLKIDELYFPTDKEIRSFKLAVGKIAEEGKVKDHQFLIDAIVPIISRVFLGLGTKTYAHDLKSLALEKVIRSWLSNGEFEHDLILSKSNPPEKTLEAFIGMATDTNLISLDFCIGHVWRHCQPTLYEAISFSRLDNEVIASIIALDERIKRYSYGPPVASLQQLLALIKADVVTLNFVENPEIKTSESGWQLSKGGKSITAAIMVNSVLDPPKLLEINSPIVCNLLHDSLVKPVHDELGIATYKNGCVRLPKEMETIPLAVLGRLSKGTLIGVDAILECFGLRSELWAEGAVDRIIG